MHTIDHEKFGTFLAQLRRERGMTQKDLAQRLFVSDKAVSKWERGLSLPDVALLQPLADIMEVSISELLSGCRIPEEKPLTAKEADCLVADALALSAQERADKRKGRRRWGMWYMAALACMAAGMALAWRQGLLRDDMISALLIPALLAAFFGAYFCFFAREKLPAFYDGNKINFYSDGAFRMNIPGVHFNNSNWPHILRVARTWCVAMTALWPAAYSALRWGLPLLLPEAVWQMALLAALSAALLGLVVPIYVVGRKYE